ncbi:MAG: hypothetical protein EZS28_026918 [Streblomastix strix]|uniref:Uncharacterized protein n=1 Tax=Streblomastix strix TaxID=222440 RepID=A0A5J4V4T0_9EUKA|nr:MAG: hypothetical protein EZS28_026918 [Streblomastix strix]
MTVLKQINHKIDEKLFDRSRQNVVVANANIRALELATHTKLAPYLWKYWIIPKYIGAIITEGTRTTKEVDGPKLQQLRQDILEQINYLVQTKGDVELGFKIYPVRQRKIQQLRDKDGD